ncbi:glycosyltransferase family 4 protein [Burkholderia sp. LMG 32019]|uniref:glycosyltransferase family 4 protein n=1 Tax=Burkholderia sp. LMG 32019 TaxID=3158173 RepID=UPI003C30E62A
MLPTGVDRVGLEYIRRYAPRARAVLSEQGFHAVLSESDSAVVFQTLLEQDFSRAAAMRMLAAKALLTAWRKTPLPGSILLHTSHSGMEFARYPKAMRRLGVRTVFMVHDLIPLTHAEYCREGVRETHRRRIHTVFEHASGVIANSGFTLDSLTEEAHRAGMTLPPTVVARLAPGIDRPVTDSRAPIDTPYFVMLGTIEPRKNHWFMLHVWRRIVEESGNNAPKLVVIGRRGWECENVVDMLERCENLKGAVVEQPNCSDRDLQVWLQHARALLFPSFVEGYGMPLVEALTMQVPVIASDLGVFREVAGDVPDYLDPLDGPGWMARIRAYSQASSPERDNQLVRISQFRAPTWAEHFARVDRFLEELG